MRTLIIAALCCPTLAAAQTGNEVSFRLGLGAQSAPAYFGADKNETGPTGSFSLEALTFGDQSVDGAATGLGFGASLRFIGERTAGDHPELAGLADIDAALELGGGLRYTLPGFAAFANVRYGLGGHESAVADFGGDFIADLGPRWELRAGARALVGSDDYAQTYFGVTAAESAASRFAAYTPEAGLVSAGLAASLTYQATPDWGIVGSLRYDQLQGDAADSPIVRDKDQMTAGLVITRRVSFGF